MTDDISGEISKEELDAITRRIDGAADKNAKKCTQLRDVLSVRLGALGVAQVLITYDGSGDEGQVEEITAHMSDDTDCTDLLDTETIQTCREFSYHDGTAWVTRDGTREQTLGQALEDLAHLGLAGHFCGWENNDGAFGEMTFHVRSNTVSITHNERYTDTNTTEIEI